MIDVVFYLLFFVWHLVLLLLLLLFFGGVDSVFGVNERIFDCVYECIGYLIDDDNDKLLNVFFLLVEVLFLGV